jgi:hypothetical protein
LLSLPRKYIKVELSYESDFGEAWQKTVATEISFNGFLSDQANEISKAIKREHKQLFFYLDEVNEKAHRYRNLWRIGSRNQKALFAAALFHRALSAYQALILLIQRGFASEARATCRNMLEAKFKLAYLLNEPEAAILLIARGEKKRADRLRDMKSGKLPVAEKLKGQDWDAVIAKAEEHLKDEKGVERKPPSMRQIAKKCGLEENFLGYYSFFSDATHSGHIELSAYIKPNAEGTGVETLLYGPKDGNWVDWVALEGAGFLIDCMELSAHIFRIRTTRDFDLLFKPLIRRNDEMVQRFRELIIGNSSGEGSLL